jgi:hypothetical protein
LSYIRRSKAIRKQSLQEKKLQFHPPSFSTVEIRDEREAGQSPLAVRQAEELYAPKV